MNAALGEPFPVSALLCLELQLVNVSFYGLRGMCASMGYQAKRFSDQQGDVFVVPLWLLLPF